MPAFNSCTFVGNLTRDVQLSFTPNQTAVADFGLAINRKWTGNDGTAREEVCFIDVRAYGKLAEIVNKYMKQGSSVLVQGHLVYEQWDSRDDPGKKHSKHRLVAEAVQFLPGGKSREAAGDEAGAPQGQIPDNGIPF